MKVNDFSKLIKSISWRSMLIEGPWGSGKTFLVKSALKISNIEYKYISLFGLSNLDSLIKIINDFIDPKFLSGREENAHFNDDVFDEIKLDDYIESPIIVFDDLERFNADYQLFFGLVNKLINIGYRVICIHASNLKNDRIFACREKTIDIVKKIDNCNADTIKEIVKNLNVETEIIKEISASNLRILKKSAEGFDYFKKILSKIDKNFVNFLNLTLRRLFYCFHAANRCVFGQESKDKSETIKNDFIKLQYNEWIKKYDINVGNEVYNLSCKKIFSDNEFDFVLRTINFLQTNDLFEIEQLFLVEDDKNKILDREMFLLSDNGKYRFTKEFSDSLINLDFAKEKNMKNLFDILGCGDRGLIFMINFESLANCLINSFDSKPMLMDVLSRYKFRLIDNEEGQGIYNELINIINDKFRENENEEIEKIINGKTNYAKLTSVLSSLDDKGSDYKTTFLNHLKEHKYLFPNISGEISLSSWKYCHLLCKIISETNSSRDLYLFLIDKYNEYSTNSGKQRINILLKQYFRSSIK